MKIILPLLLCLFAVATSADPSAPITPETLQARLSLNGSLHCAYEQTRNISGMARPLRASGTLEISPETGLVLRQTKPFAQTFRITPDRIETTLERQPPEIITARDNPRLFQFNQLLSALFRADHAALSESFTPALSGTLDAWTLQLEPRDDLLQKIFLRISLTGGRHIDTLRIEDRQNDTTLLRFFDHRTPPAAAPALHP
ncbi:outer membrane lipoprotein carrier protein LolA [Opitutaceae bacterium TAV4]|nr:outer membrane lipoprotein carrier protein LolA [Opitutaceae bacterium TAV4]RRJ99375.1 outer membrane lipoprotein carrier protein LolA [Opitutaceae bacterium TAV3]